ncbi:MAG: hypothetical protein ACTSUE_20290 [Promethearchaeota archaeon]
MGKKTTDDCSDCKFNIAADDEMVHCEFLKMLGKSDSKCDKFEEK